MTELLLRIGLWRESHLPPQHRPHLLRNPGNDTVRFRCFLESGTHDELAKERLVIVHVAEVQHYFDLVSFHLQGFVSAN